MKFNNQKVLKSIENLKTEFLHDSRPWVVTFSGGKDSTVVLQLVIEMLLGLKKPGVEFLGAATGDTHDQDSARPGSGSVLRGDRSGCDVRCRGRRHRHRAPGQHATHHGTRRGRASR